MRPVILFGQDDSSIYVTIEVRDAKNVVVQAIEDNRIALECDTADKKRIECDLTLWSDIVVPSTTNSIEDIPGASVSALKIELQLEKREAGVKWLRLTKEKDRMVKVDWNHWIDSDDEGDDDRNATASSSGGGGRRGANNTLPASDPFSRFDAQPADAGNGMSIDDEMEEMYEQRQLRAAVRSRRTIDVRRTLYLLGTHTFLLLGWCYVLSQFLFYYWRDNDTEMFPASTYPNLIKFVYAFQLLNGIHIVHSILGVRIGNGGPADDVTTTTTTTTTSDGGDGETAGGTASQYHSRAPVSSTIWMYFMRWLMLGLIFITCGSRVDNDDDDSAAAAAAAAAAGGGAGTGAGNDLTSASSAAFPFTSALADRGWFFMCMFWAVTDCVDLITRLVDIVDVQDDDDDHDDDDANHEVKQHRRVRLYTFRVMTNVFIHTMSIVIVLVELRVVYALWHWSHYHLISINTSTISGGGSSSLLASFAQRIPRHLISAILALSAFSKAAGALALVYTLVLRLQKKVKNE